MAIVQAKLVDPTHKLPLPDQPELCFPAQGTYPVDDADPFWFGCIRDRSIEVVPPAPPAPPPPPEAPLSSRRRGS